MQLHVPIIGREGRPRGEGAIVLDSREERREDRGFEVGEGGPRGAGPPWGGGGILVRCLFLQM